jgi:bifunctional non-homologous end joining protein LigD
MVEIRRYTVEISSRDKIYFPEAGLTNGDLIDNYQQVADTMVPYLRRYGISTWRFPDGLQGEGFYTKNAPDYFPSWIKTVKVPKRESGVFEAPIVDKPAVLIYLADQSVITFHLYLPRINDLEYPDNTSSLFAFKPS